MQTSRERGSHWERHAESFLRDRGLKPLTRNFRSRFGEIDLVMLDGAALVFVEVRYRRTDRFGSGAETVTAAKQQRLASAARHYLARRRQHRHRRCRFDVVSIGGRDGEATVDWIRHAFEVD